jgi:hypothetical protein
VGKSFTFLAFLAFSDRVSGEVDDGFLIIMVPDGDVNDDYYLASNKPRFVSCFLRGAGGAC